MPETRLPRAIIPGDMGDRPDLYDVETSDFVASAASPELARWLCRTVWEQSKQEPLLIGEKPIERPLAEKLDRDLLRPHLPGCRVFGAECDCESIIASRVPEASDDDALSAARDFLRWLGDPGRTVPASDVIGSALTHMRALMRALGGRESTAAEDPRLDAESVQDVAMGTVASAPRDPSPTELVDQLTWETRRLAEAQYDVGTTLGRLRTSVAQYEQ